MIFNYSESFMPDCIFRLAKKNNIEVEYCPPHTKEYKAHSCMTIKVVSVSNKKNTFNYDFYPGSMGLAGLCVNLFGADAVNPNNWTLPVTVYGITKDDAETVVFLAKEKGVSLTYKPAGT